MTAKNRENNNCYREHVSGGREGVYEQFNTSTRARIINMHHINFRVSYFIIFEFRSLP